MDLLCVGSGEPGGTMKSCGLVWSTPLLLTADTKLQRLIAGPFYKHYIIRKEADSFLPVCKISMPLPVAVNALQDWTLLLDSVSALALQEKFIFIYIYVKNFYLALWRR